MAERELQASIRQLVRANLDLEAAAGVAESKTIAAFRKAEARAFNRLAELLSGAPDFSSTNLQRRLAWYFENIPSLELAQINAGYFSAVESYLDNYRELQRLASRVLEAGRVPANFTDIPRELTDALTNRDRLFFSELNADALRKLDDVLLNQVIVGRTPAGTLEAVRGTITGSYPWGKTRGLYEWHAGTYVRTAGMRFSRSILTAQADALNLEWFVYVGPVDSKKRPFCLGIVGGAYSRQEIEDMDNGQTGDTFSDGGGYNCRDTWSPVDKSLADQIREETDAVRDEIRTQSDERRAVRDRSGVEVPTGRRMGNDQWIRSLTSDEAAAFDTWKGSGYIRVREQQIADALGVTNREGGPFANPKYSPELPATMQARLREQARTMSQAMDRAQAYDGVVYRGMRIYDEDALAKLIGSDSFQWDAFSSWSKDLEVAKNFGNVLLRVTTRGRGVDIQNIDGARTEAEVVLRPGKFRIKRVQRFLHPEKGLGESGHKFRDYLIDVEEVL